MRSGVDRHGGSDRNPSTLEVEANPSEVQGHRWLSSKYPKTSQRSTWATWDPAQPKKYNKIIVKKQKRWQGRQKAVLARIFTFPTAGNRCSTKQHRYRLLLPTPPPTLFVCPLLVPTRYGVVLGAVIGGILGVVLLLLLLFYLIRYCWLRRQATLQRRLR